MKKQLVCVNCPKGCRITVTFEQDRITDIIGYGCKQGKNYARQESTEPMRVLTSTVRILNGTQRVLPVITENEIPLRLWKEAMTEIRKVSIQAPVTEGQVLIHDFLHTGVNLIASRSMNKSRSCNC